MTKVRFEKKKERNAAQTQVLGKQIILFTGKVEKSHCKGQRFQEGWRIFSQCSRRRHSEPSFFVSKTTFMLSFFHTAYLWNPGWNTVVRRFLSSLGTSVLAPHTYSLLEGEATMQIFSNKDFLEVEWLTGDGLALFGRTRYLIKVFYMNDSFLDL